MEQIVVIDDVRYQNEIDAIIRMGNYVPCYCRRQIATPTARWRNHESEKLAKALDKQRVKESDSLLQDSNAMGQTL